MTYVPVLLRIEKTERDNKSIFLGEINSKDHCRHNSLNVLLSVFTKIIRSSNVDIEMAGEGMEEK